MAGSTSRRRHPKSLNIPQPPWPFLLGVVAVGFCIRLKHYFLAAPPEVVWLIPAVVVIAVFHRHLNQAAKLVIACLAVLAGRIQREVLAASPESGLSFEQLFRRLYDPRLLFVGVLLFGVYRQFVCRSKRVADKQARTEGVDESKDFQWLFRRMWCKVAPLMRAWPLLQLALLIVLAALVLFVRLQPSDQDRPSVGDAGFRQIQAQLSIWNDEHRNLTTKLNARQSPYLSPMPGMERARITRRCEILSTRIAKFEAHFHQLRDRLDLEAQERIVTPQEVQFYDSVLCHETLVDQYTSTAAEVRAAQPDFLGTVTFEDRYSTVIGGTTYGFNSSSLQPADQQRLAADYDRKGEEASKQLARMKQAGIAAAPFDPLAAHQTLKAQPLALSQKARTLLSQHILQRLHSEPWRLGLALDLFALKRLEGFALSLPSSQTCFGYGFIAAMVYLCVTTIRSIPEGMRRSADQVRSAQRTGARLARTIFLTSSRNRRSR